MKIEQFEDKNLSHYSYAILSECEQKVVLIDPARNIEPYIQFAAQNDATIIGAIETHPHADFVSSHLELHKKTGAVIYCSKLLGATYQHQGFDDGDIIDFGKLRLKAMNTPGHSPDSICILLEHAGKDKAIFTGDTLFIGDCGRPDLRENAGSITAERKVMAKQMYASLREKILLLDNDVLVYPAHGAGSLCGKALSKANHSTIGAEKLSNWSLQKMGETEFVNKLLEDQPFVPKYFPFDVELNKTGAGALADAVKNVPIGDGGLLNGQYPIIDTRSEKHFKENHLQGSTNIQNETKFETWLGSIVSPKEPFYLVSDNKKTLEDLINRAAKIGYETFIKQAFIFSNGNEKCEVFDIEAFRKCESCYTIVDVRAKSEVIEHPIFKNAVNIPLNELRERVLEMPTDKPLVIHCAGGYRSAIGSSIVNNTLGQNAKVFDFGEAIQSFIKN